MKIGIITYHCADNYGAVLQCYALQEVLKKKGHEVEIIDYRNPVVLNDYRVSFDIPTMLLYLFTFKLSSFIKYIPKYFFQRKRKADFENFREKYLNRTKQVTRNTIPQYYDRIVIGSDQMWTIACCKKYEPVYFGDFPRSASCKLYGYAISSKGDFFMPLSVDALKTIIKGFSNLSFREEKIKELIKVTTGNDYPVCLDPTLLTDTEHWDAIVDDKWKKKKYVAIYQVRRSVSDPYAIDRIAQKYAKDHNLKMINLERPGYSIEDFVSIIKYAQAVFTSSFHATVFSIIFNTPFKSYCLNDGNDDRYVNLLRHLHLDNNISNQFVDVENVYSYDETQVKKHLVNLRRNSFSYIDSICEE